MGTDALDNCPATATADDETVDAWPPDFNDDTLIDIEDISQLTYRFNTSPPDPNYDQRYDLNADGVIDIEDLLYLYPPFFNTTCVSAESQIVDVIKATEQYRDVQVAENDGFLQATQYIPGRGAYFVRPDRWDATLNLMEPEGLLYKPTDGGWRLMGTFHLVPSWLVPDPPEGFIGDDDVWSIHYGFCIDANLEASEGVTKEECGAAGGVWWDEMGHVLFAWLYRFNPDGVFTEINPNVN